VEADRERARPPHRVRPRPDRGTLPLGRPGTHRPAHRLDLFALRKRSGWLGPLYDAEYGSASFVPVDRPMELEVRVSTTGLLLREAKK
jgi:hypothetical protein